VTRGDRNPGSKTIGGAVVDFGEGCFGLSLLDPELDPCAVNRGGPVVY